MMELKNSVIFIKIIKKTDGFSLFFAEIIEKISSNNNISIRFKNLRVHILVGVDLFLVCIQKIRRV